MEAIKNENGTWDVKGMPDWRVTFNQFCELVRFKMPFKFARYGDGEFNCMMGNKGANCDGHEYSPKLGADLEIAAGLTLVDYGIVTGIQPLSISQQKYKNWESFFPAKSEFVNADIFHNASICGDLEEFCGILDNRKTVLVGPNHLDGNSLIMFDYHISIPDKNCYADIERIFSEMNKRDQKDDGLVFILCASMMSEVLIHRFRNSENTFIDFGSVLDPYAGVKSRKYHHKLSI